MPRTKGVADCGMTIPQLAEKYLSEREHSRVYALLLRRVARSLGQAGIAVPSAFSPDSFNRWLASLPFSPTTRGNYRRSALTLWKFAARLGLGDNVGEGIIRVKHSANPPIAWSMDELRRLVSHCQNLRGTLKSGCPKSTFWTAFVLAGYELGIRRGDLHQLKCSQVRGNRVFVVQNKTGVPIGKIVTNELAVLLSELRKRGDGKTVFKWALSSDKWVHAGFKDVVKGAGLTGSIRYLRRSGATHCEIHCPGSAGRFLGHLSPGLAQRFYLDPTLMAETQPRPPGIIGTDSRTLGCAS